MPIPRTWVDREIPPYSTINPDVYGTLSWLLAPPMCKVRQTVAQSIPRTTFTAMNYQIEDFDPYNWHNSVTNTSRITPTFPGWYRGWFGIAFAATTGGNYRTGYVRQNGSAAGGRSRRDNKPTTVGQDKITRGIPFFLQFNGTTDYAEVLAYQDTAGAMLTTVANQIHQADFFLRWWAPL